MEPFRRAFVRFLLECDALRFGDFTTKSGRKSPYFINTGMIRTGAQLARMGEFYAHAIEHHFGGSIDNLYGPAYKGIPLAVASAAALHRLYNRDLGVSFNRKEAKDHGEGGLIVGQPYDRPSRVLIVEDVITAGTSVRETMELMKNYPNAKIEGLIVSVDRMEKVGDENLSALEQVRREHGVKTVSIITIDDLMGALVDRSITSLFPIAPDQLDRMKAYRERYGATGAGEA